MCDSDGRFKWPSSPPGGVWMCDSDGSGGRVKWPSGPPGGPIRKGTFVFGDRRYRKSFIGILLLSGQLGVGEPWPAKKAKRDLRLRGRVGEVSGSLSTAGSLLLTNEFSESSNLVIPCSEKKAKRDAKLCGRVREVLEGWAIAAFLLPTGEFSGKSDEVSAVSPGGGSSCASHDFGGKSVNPRRDR